MNESNQLAKSYDYDAFGVEKNPSNEDDNPFRYCGEYYDVETGTYYLRARYYDPRIGRFTSEDTHWNTSNMIYGDNPQKINEREDKLGLKTYSYVPQISAVIQSGNLYVYAVGNPLYYKDINGYFSIQAFVEGAILASVGILTVATVVGTGGTCAPVVAALYATLATAGTVGAIVGTSEMVESVSGKNYVKEYVGSQSYNIIKDASASIMALGTDIIAFGETSESIYSQCFIKGTLIATENADIPIESIRVGALVWSYDSGSGSAELKPVIRTFVKEVDKLVHIRIPYDEIICTPEHPFYTINGWKAACELSNHDILVGYDKCITINSVDYETLNYPVEVFNFEVEEFHTYYVSESSVLVHNACGKAINHNISGDYLKVKSSVARMSNSEKNRIIKAIQSGKDIAFSSKNEAVAFIDKYLPNYTHDGSGVRSKLGWQDHTGLINNEMTPHINIYDKKGNNSHIVWGNKW